MYIRRSKIKSGQGFTLIEVLFSLSITLLILLNISSITKIINITKKFNYYENEASVAAYKVTNYLLMANYTSIDDSLEYIENDKTYKIALDGDRIVITPGYNIIMDDVDDLEFYEDNDKIYMRIECHNYTYKYLVGANYAYKE